MSAREKWDEAKVSWQAAQEALVARLRPLYLAEVARFAETLRPDFEAGRLYGYRGGDNGTSIESTPIGRLEELCAEHFGIQVDDEERDGNAYQVERDFMTARMILAVSPSADGASDPGAEAESFNAQFAAAWDVLAVARARGWYKPTPDESPDVEETRWVEAA